MNGSKKILELEDELSKLREITLASMTSSSDLGLVVQFLKKSFSIKDYDTLGREAIQDLLSIGLSACLIVETYTGRIFINGSNVHDAELESRVRSAMLQGRIVETEDSIQFNSEKVSLLVNNLTNDEARKGQLRDVIMLLLDGLEARVENLILEEKAREARQSKDEFFALMSHELRTPLNPIIGFSSKLEKRVGSEIDAKFEKPIKAIRNNGESLLGLINNIIDLGRLEAGEIAINRANFHVSDAIDHVVVKLSDYAETRKATITRSVAEDLYFYADPPRFIDIVHSLVSYSLKHHASTEVAIDVKADITENNEDYLHIRVIDNGKTLGVEQKNRLFDHFAHRDVSSINDSNNLGMGLYLTKKLIDLHNGSVCLNNRDCGGNEFNIKLPMVIQDATPES